MAYDKPLTRCFMMDAKASNCSHQTFKSFSMPDIREILVRYRLKDATQGLPKRDISPLSTWLLDASIDEFFENYSKDYVLEQLLITDNRKK